MKTYKLVIHFINGKKLVLNHIIQNSDREIAVETITEEFFKKTFFICEYANVVYHISTDKVAYTEILEQ